MKILARSRLTSEERLSLPASVQRLFGMQPGDNVIWMKDDDGRILVERARSHTLADIRAAVAAGGSVPKRDRVSVRAMKQGIAGHVQRRHGRD